LEQIQRQQPQHPPPFLPPLQNRFEIDAEEQEEDSEDDYYGWDEQELNLEQQPEQRQQEESRNEDSFSELSQGHYDHLNHGSQFVVLFFYRY